MVSKLALGASLIAGLLLVGGAVLTSGSSRGRAAKAETAPGVEAASISGLSNQTKTQGARDLELSLPVNCQLGRDCLIQNYVDRDPSPGSKDFKGGSRTYDKHNGTDIRLVSMVQQRRGVPVLAAADGKVIGSRDGVPDVSVRDRGQAAVSGQECGNGVLIDHGGGWQTQYCHLAQGSISVRNGQSIPAGTAVGKIGLSGQTEYPHLHFTVRHNGEVVDPFAPGNTSQRAGSLWSRSSGLQSAYKEREVLNAGFSNAPVTMEEVIERGSAVQPLDSSAPALVPFVQAVGLKSGDVQQLTLISPAGEVLADNVARPLARDQAQSLIFAGKRRPSAGWQPGTYTARYIVRRDERPVLERSFSLQLR